MEHMEGPEIDLHKYSKLVFYKGTNKKGQSFQQVVLECITGHPHAKKMYINPYLTPL